MYFFGLLLAIILALLFFKSIKFVMKILINTIAGIIILYVFNIFAIKYNLNIEITAFNSFMTGAFGMYYVVILIAIKIFLG